MSDQIGGLPHAITKRDLLFGVRKATSAEWRAWADKFLAADWAYDGIDFLGRADDRAALEALVPKVVDEGNVFLLQKIQRALGLVDLDDAHRRHLQTCSEKAAALGKNRYAIRGFEKLGQNDRVESLRALIASDGDIRAEAQANVFIPSSEETELESEET